jgi:hypothetical protein
MVTPRCTELRGFGQCIISTEYNGDLGFCVQGKNNGGPVGNSEVVYLSNCSSGGQQSSEMNYYSNSGQSKNGERPAATAQVMQNRYITWEGNKVIGTFPDGNHFTSQITDHNGPVDSVKGSGSNNYHAFTCHQDSPYLLYSAGAQTCTRVYYCVP